MVKYWKNLDISNASLKCWFVSTKAWLTLRVSSSSAASIRLIPIYSWRVTPSWKRIFSNFLKIKSIHKIKDLFSFVPRVLENPGSKTLERSRSFLPAATFKLVSFDVSEVSKYFIFCSSNEKWLHPRIAELSSVSDDDASSSCNLRQYAFCWYFFYIKRSFYPIRRVSMKCPE